MIGMTVASAAAASAAGAAGRGPGGCGWRRRRARRGASRGPRPGGRRRPARPRRRSPRGAAARARAVPARRSPRGGAVAGRPRRRIASSSERAGSRAAASRYDAVPIVVCAEATIWRRAAFTTSAPTAAPPPAPRAATTVSPTITRTSGNSSRYGRHQSSLSSRSIIVALSTRAPSAALSARRSAAVWTLPSMARSSACRQRRLAVRLGAHRRLGLRAPARRRTVGEQRNGDRRRNQRGTDESLDDQQSVASRPDTTNRRETDLP